MEQFSIRDLLFGVVIVALVLGWWLDRRPKLARFQIRTTTNSAFVLDTSTGEVWSGQVDKNGTLRAGPEFTDPKLPK